MTAYHIIAYDCIASHLIAQRPMIRASLMALTERHTYQVLTKRPERMLEFLSHPQTPAAVELFMQAIKPDARLPQWPLKNVWVGTSTEDQRRLNERLCPAN